MVTLLHLHSALNLVHPVSVYEDVLPALKAWKALGCRVYIYSSGSIAAQQLLFRNSSAGDLRRFLDGYYDTTTGIKQEASSYISIANTISEPTDQCAFFTGEMGGL